MSDARPSRVAWLQLGLVVVLFGLAWPVIRIGLDSGTPIWLAAARATRVGDDGVRPWSRR